jgi:hypothetical protein
MNKAITLYNGNLLSEKQEYAHVISKNIVAQLPMLRKKQQQISDIGIHLKKELILEKHKKSKKKANKLRRLCINLDFNKLFKILNMLNMIIS